jgi:group I intron endonuclease
VEKNEEYPKKAGIYKLTCIQNGKIYIGKSVCIYRRLHNHKNCSKNLSGRWHFENALIKYGWSSFSVEILEIFENFDKNNDDHRKLLLEKESNYIKLFDSTSPNIGYNQCKFSTDSTGIRRGPPSAETRLKMSLSQKGKPRSRESVEKMRKTKTGIPHKGHSTEALLKMRESKLGVKRPEFSEEWKKNIGNGHRGLVMSEESRNRISSAHKGKPKSKESVEKMRKSLTGRKHSEETKIKMSNSQKGRKLSEEHKQILIQCNKNRTISLETREKMRNSQKGKKNNLGKVRSEESKEKSRKSRLAYLEKIKEVTEEQQFLEDLKPLIEHLNDNPISLLRKIDGIIDLDQSFGRVYYMNLVDVSNDNKLPETNLQ